MLNAASLSPTSGFSRLLLHRLRVRYTSKATAATVPGSNTPATIAGKPASEVYDDRSDRLQTIDIEDLPRAQKRYAIQFEELNAQRIKEIFAKNYKNHIAMAVLATLVVSIYYYTIHAVKQETFLEEIDEEVSIEKGEVVPVTTTPA